MWWGDILGIIFPLIEIDSTHLPKSGVRSLPPRLQAVPTALHSELIEVLLSLEHQILLLHNAPCHSKKLLLRGAHVKMSENCAITAKPASQISRQPANHYYSTMYTALRTTIYTKGSRKSPLIIPFSIQSFLFKLKEPYSVVSNKQTGCNKRTGLSKNFI